MAKIYKNNIAYGTTNSAEIYYKNTGLTVKQKLDEIVELRKGFNRNLLFKEKCVGVFNTDAEGNGNYDDVRNFLDKYDIHNGNFYGLELGNYITLKNFKIKDKFGVEVIREEYDLSIIGFDSFMGKCGGNSTTTLNSIIYRHHLILMPRIVLTGGANKRWDQPMQNAEVSANGRAFQYSTFIRKQTEYNLLYNFNRAITARFNFGSGMTDKNTILHFGQSHATMVSEHNNGASESNIGDIETSRYTSDFLSISQVTGTNLTGNIYDMSTDCEQLPIWAITGRANLYLNSAGTGFWCRESKSYTAFSLIGGYGDTNFRDGMDENGYPIRPFFLFYDPEHL